MVKSETPIQKSFRISMFGNCEDLADPSAKKEVGLTCELEQTVELQVSEESSLRK